MIYRAEKLFKLYFPGNIFLIGTFFQSRVSKYIRDGVGPLLLSPDFLFSLQIINRQYLNGILVTCNW